MTALPNIATHVQIASDHGFAETVARIANAIAKAGLIMLVRLDHSNGAASVGLDMPPSLVLVYGHPNGGTPIMKAYPSAALDLPLRVLVCNDTDGRTFVAYRPIVALLAQHGVPEELSGRLEPAQALIAESLRG